MGIKHSQSRLPTEFHDAIFSVENKNGVPPNLEKEIHNIRLSYGDIKAKAIADGNAIKQIEKTVYQIPDSTGSDNINIFVYTPDVCIESLPVIYWLHGGGLVLGCAEQDEFTLKSFAQNHHCIVISPEYRLAPEHRFPTPLDDCYQGLVWMFEQSDKLNIDTSRIIVAGESAGGGLAATLVQRVADEGAIPIKHQLLIYPMLDCLNQADNNSEPDDIYIWNYENNLYGWSSYLGGDPRDVIIPKYASAFHCHPLDNLPPATILVGDLDLFLFENINYAARLAATGIPIELRVYPGGVHSFEYINPKAPISRAFIHDREECLRTVLAK